MELVQERPSAAKQKILQTALRLFYSNGIRATGVDTIIAESDVAKATFYKHFPSKQDLILEVLKVGGEIWMKDLRKFIDKKRDPRDKLLGVFDFLEHWFKSPHFRGCAFINTTSESANRRLKECLFSARFKHELAVYLAGIASQAKVKHPQRVADKLLLLIDGATVRANMDPHGDAAKMARSIAELII